MMLQSVCGAMVSSSSSTTDTVGGADADTTEQLLKGPHRWFVTGRIRHFILCVGLSLKVMNCQMLGPADKDWFDTISRLLWVVIVSSVFN